MLRRSRISVRPNVRPAGRAGPSTASQDAPTMSQETPQPNEEAQSIEAPAEVKEMNKAVAVTDKPSVTPVETTTAALDTNDQNVEGASCSTASSASLQRRKRFTVKPRVAPTLTRTSVRAPKSPVKAVSESPVQAPVPDSEMPSTSSQSDTTAPQGLRSPGRRRPSGGSRQPRTQPKPSLPSPILPGPTVSPSAEDPSEQIELSADNGKQSECLPGSQAKEVPPKPPDKVHPSLPEKEAIEISERAKTLVSKSTKSGLSLPTGKSSLSRLLNDPADLQRMAKARKLRELLKQEMHKEKHKKSKSRVKEYTLDIGKMTMRDLIYYLPNTNPMTSYLEETVCENETVVPPSQPREESPVRAQEPETHPEPESQREEEEEDDDEEEKDEPLMVPRVKVAEDGSLIIDEESLTVEVLRAKGPNPADDGDPIFERGSTTTYSSFRKGHYTKPWSSQETDMFFLAISMVGTDFSMICQLFPHRARSEIKNKFKKEERINSWRIDKAFRERRKLDLEFFSKLLEKILEVQNSKNKKPKSPNEKKAARKRNTKPKEKKVEKKLSDVEEEEEEEDEDGELDLVEGEKENEDISNEGGTPASTLQKKHKRRDGVEGESSPEKPTDKKKKGKQNDKQEEACVPEDAEAALPEDQPTVDRSEKTDESVNATKGSVIKPAQLSRGRAPKPLLQLGRKWGKKVPVPSPTKPKDGAPATENENSGEGLSNEQVSEDASPSRPAKEKKKGDNTSSEGEEDSSLAPPKPTRYGRMPKPVQHLNYPAKEDTHPSASETSLSSASSAGTTTSAAKRKLKPSARNATSPEPKKPKLVTLRASQSESSDDEDEEQREGEEMEEEELPSSPYKDSSAPAFVPLGLRSPQPVVSVVEETMEELDISVNVPDVLGISQDALCPDASCEQAQGTTGTVPCEHQLDLLVDVIDFLSADHMEESEASYNEAAQTLLTIGNLAHLSQSTQDSTSTQNDAPTQDYTSTQDYTTAGAPFISVDETCNQDLQEDMVSQPIVQLQSNTTPVTETYDLIETEASQTVETLEPDTSTIDSAPVPQLCEMPVIETREVTPSRPEQGATVTETYDLIEMEASQSVETFEPDTSTDDSAPVPQLCEMPVIETREVTPSRPEHGATVTETYDLIETEASQSVETFEPDTRTIDSVPVPQLCEMPVIETREVTPSRPEQGPTDQEAAPQLEPSPESSEESVFQTRRGRLPKIKPKPNLGRATRTAQSKSQPTENPITSPVKTVEESSITPSDISRVTQPLPMVEESSSPITDSVPASQASDIPTTKITPTEEPSVIHEKSAIAGIIPQIESGSEISEQSAPQSRRSRFSKIKPELNLDRSTRTTQSKPQSTDETLESPVRTTENTSTTPPGIMTSDSSVVESQSVVESITIDSVMGHQSSDHPVTAATPVEESSANKAEGSEAGPTSQTRRSRFSKVKPKPNLGRASRTIQSKSQCTDDTATNSEPIETPSSPTLKPQSTESIATHVEPQQITESIAPQPPSSAPASASVTSFELRSTCTPTEKSSTSEEQRTEADRVDSSLEDSGKNGAQIRRGRFPKVKPKPNLGLSANTTRTQSQPTKDTNKLSPSELRESSSNASSEPKPIKDNNKHLELETVEKASRHLIPPQSPSKTKDPSSEAPEPERSSEETATGIITSEPVVTETSRLVEDPFMVTDSVREPQSSDKSTAGVAETVQMSSTKGKTAEAASTSQVASISEQNVPQTRRGRLSKIKPKPNLGRATRTRQSIPQPTEDTFTHSEPEVSENTSNTYSETQPTKDVGLHLEPQIAENSNKQSIPLQSTSISENSSSIVHTAVPVSLSEVINVDYVVAETSWVIDDPFVVTESVPEIQSIEMPSAEVTTTEESFTSEKKSKGTEVENVPQVESDSEQTLPLTRRGRISRVKPKPNLGRATRTARSKPQPAEDTATQINSDEPESLQTEPQPSTDTSPFTAPKPAEIASKHSIPQYFAQPTEQQIDEAFTSAPESRRLTEEITSETMTSESVVSESSSFIEDPFLMDESEDSEMPITAAMPRDEPSSSQIKTEVGSALQKEPSSEQNVPQTRRSHLPKVKPKPNLRRATRTTESKPQSTEDTTTILEPLSTKDGFRPSVTTSTHSEPEAKVHIQPSYSENTDAIRMGDSEVKGHDASREQLYEDKQNKQSNKDDSAQAQCAEDTQLGQSDSEQSSKKAPQTHRARFPEPKPNLCRSSRPAHSQLAQNATQPEPVSGTWLEALEASASQIADCKPSSDIQEPVDGASVEQMYHDNPPSDTSTAPVCITQIPVDSIQDTTPPGSVESQSHPVFITNPDVQSEQVPEEPFFILSLTEIPVFPSREEMSSVSEPLPYFPIPDATIQLQSAPSTSLSSDLAPGGSLAVGGDGALCNVIVPMSMEEGEEKRSTSVEDVVPGPASSVMKTPEDPHEMAEAQPSKMPEAVESSVEEEMDLPHKKRRVPETQRRAKLQVKPNTSCRKQPSRTTTAKEAELTPTQMHTIRESELTCPPARPEISGTSAGDGVFEEPQKTIVGHLDAEKDTSTGGSATEASTSGAETSHHITLPSMSSPQSRPGRRPKGFLSFISNKSNAVPSRGSQQAKAASHAPQVNTSRTGRKRAAPAPISSRVRSQDAASTPQTTALPEATLSTSTITKTTTQPKVDVTETSDVCRLHPDPEPSTSSFITEVPAIQQVESADIGSPDEEPINISQYFLSDIFIEVDESDG